MGSTNNLVLPTRRLVKLLSEEMHIKVEAVGIDAVRVLVSTYYDVQDQRIRYNGRSRAAQRLGAPAAPAADAVYVGFAGVEEYLRQVMEAWIDFDPVAQRLNQIIGIGPVLAVGLVAFADPRRCPTDKVSSFWRFCGYAPGDRLRKGQKSVFSQNAKLTCWKIGAQWVRLGEKTNSFYAQHYRAWKAEYVRRNEAGEYAEKAKAELESRNFRASETKKAYMQGRYPAGRLDLMARRKAIKLFLSHYWEIVRKEAGLPCRKPWIVAQDRSHAYIPPPRNEWFPE